MGGGEERLGGLRTLQQPVGESGGDDDDHCGLIEVLRGEETAVPGLHQERMLSEGCQEEEQAAVNMKWGGVLGSAGLVC